MKKQLSANEKIRLIEEKKNNLMCCGIPANEAALIAAAMVNADKEE